MSYSLTILKCSLALGRSDHSPLRFNFKIKTDKTKVKQCNRNFRKSNYKEMGNILAHIDSKE